jgi:hypothetical protein
VGKEPGELKFTSGLDTMNHVVAGNEGGETIRVEIVRLDDLLKNRVPVLIKIDTEGFELAALEGAAATLANPELMALIVELNGSCRRYNVEEADIHRFILERGFSAISYNPFERSFTHKPTFNANGNTIYIKNETGVRNRLESSRKFKVLDLCV